MNLTRAALAVLVACFAISVASAQSGNLTVIVTDSTGPLPGATVTISHPTGYVKTASYVTNAKGVVEFPVLRATGSGTNGYTVTVTMPGMATRVESNVNVNIGQTTQLPVQLSEELIERITVKARSEVVDLEKTTQSTRFTDDFIQDLPVPGRFYQNVLTLAPGVQDANNDGNPNVHGSRDRDFKAIVGGVSNVDPLTGQQMSQVNPNSIEEMEVITAGAGVEFSRAQGGFARILQKQGSNEFEGIFEFYFRSSKLDGTGAADFSNLPDQDFDWYQPSVQVSGPIVRDKLWYRLSHEFIYRDIPVNVTSGIEVITDDQEVHADQLTWQASPRNKLAFQFQYDPRDINNFGVSSTRPAESAEFRGTRSEVYTLTWTAPVSPKILVESQVAWQDLNTQIAPSTTGLTNDCFAGPTFIEQAQCQNLENGEISGSAPRDVDDNRQRLTVKTDATLYGGRFWGMQHQFKFGMSVENERYFRQQTERPTISFFLIDTLSDDPDGGSSPETIAVGFGNFTVPAYSEVTARGISWGIYAEDQIRPANNVTITLGARIDREEVNSNGTLPFTPEDEAANFLQLVQGGLSADQAFPISFTAYEGLDDFLVELGNTLGVRTQDLRQRLSSSAQQSNTFWQKVRRIDNIRIDNTNLSPFLSVAWDPWSNGKTKLSATARRYYDKVYLNIPLEELESPNTDLAFNASLLPDPDTQVPTWTIGQGVSAFRSSVNPAVNIQAVDRNLKTPYNDEITLGFERELWAETSIKLTYVNRKYRDQFQDVDLNHVPGDWGACVVATLSNPVALDPLTDLDRQDMGIVLDPAYLAANPFGDGILDDCIGEVDIPPNQDTGDDPFANGVRLERPDGVTDLYTQNPGWGSIYYISNLNQADYTGYVVELTRRQYRSWEMQASYTWSKATGDGEDYNQALGDDQSLLQDEKGFQSNDQRHVVKFNATTITPWGFRLGGSVSWQSGLPYSLLSQKASFDPVPPVYGSQGSGTTSRIRQTYKTGQRNDQRNDSYWNVDLKFTKEMNLARGLNLQFSAEVFNLLNDGTYMIFNPITETGQQINGINVAQRRFGRQWQMGIKVAF